MVATEAENNPGDRKRHSPMKSHKIKGEDGRESKIIQLFKGFGYFASTVLCIQTLFC